MLTFEASQVVPVSRIAVSARPTHRHINSLSGRPNGSISSAVALARALLRTTTMSTSSVTAVLLAGFAASGPALAGESALAVRKAAFERLADKDYRSGIEGLKEAYRLDPHPQDLYNIAAAHEKWAGHCHEALAGYRAYIEACPECRHVNTAREKTLVLDGLCGKATPQRSGAAAYTTLDVEGWAEIRGDDLATARKSAIADGLLQSVQMVVGVELAGLSSDVARSQVEGSHERFAQQVHSELRTRSAGYVRQYRVVTDTREGRLLRVHLRVEVDNARLRSDVDQIAQRIARARYPRLILTVEEHYRDQAGGRTETRHFLGFLSHLLAEKGFEVLVGSDARDASSAAAAGADYFITARVDVRHTGFNRRGANEHYAEASINIGLTDLGSGAAVVETSRAGSSPSSIFSEARLTELTVAHVAGDIGDVLIRQLLDSWAHAAKSGVRYQLELHGMRRYELEGRAFLAAVKQTLGVSMVKERGQEEDRLMLEIRYPAGVDISTLREAILRSLSDIPAFANLASDTRGRTLYFRMAATAPGSENSR
jgi:hypothetical protein